jgi:hypothetical protein
VLYDPIKVQARRKEAMRRELNRPVVVECFPANDLAARQDAAVLAWFDKLCELYDIDPAAPSRWEQLATRLALERFSKFGFVGSQPKVGNPGTKDDVMELFCTFQNYELPRGSGSKYKNFLRDHRAACTACKIKTAGSLKEAMRLARRRQDANRRDEELLIRHETMMALGIHA